MIVEAAVFVIGKKDDGIFPTGAVTHGVNYLRDVCLAALNVGGRMLIIFCGGAGQAEIGVDEGDGGQRAGCGLGQESSEREEVRIVIAGAGGDEGAEAGALRSILIIVGPGNVVLIEQIENCSSNGFIAGAAGGRESVVGGEMAKGCGGH